MEPIDLTHLVTQFYWPALVLTFIIIFRKPISAILKEKKIRITLPGQASVQITAEDAEQTLSQVFTEFYLVYSKLLHPRHKEYFHTILNAETRLHVSELIEGFDRKNEEHIGALRALRGLGLIEPKSGGSWKPDSIIEVTKFGRVFVDYLKLKDVSA